MLAPEQSLATLELKVNFVRPGICGRRVTARGSIDHLGRFTAVGTGRVLDEDDRLIAVGLVTVAIGSAAGEGSLPPDGRAE
jgi:uncharacterized protein (TIGR00369 family)